METAIEPRHPNRFEKNANIGPKMPQMVFRVNYNRRLSCPGSLEQVRHLSPRGQDRNCRGKVYCFWIVRAGKMNVIQFQVARWIMASAKFWLTIAVVLGLFGVAYELQQQNALPRGNTVMAAADDADLKWQPINGNDQPHLRRAKILGGWLVCAGDSTPPSAAVSITFVPDIYHEWDGKSMK